MSVRASLTIIRPANCGMIGLAVIVGYFVSKPASIFLGSIAAGFVTGFAICAYSMVINDYYDLEVDRVNQPTRPLPSGAISPQGALMLAMVMLAVGLLAAAILESLPGLGIASLYALLSWLYNAKAKAYGLSGNAIVASSLAIPFIYGGVVARGEIFDSLLLFMAGTSFLSGVGREVVKAMADTPGDEKRGIRSYARVRGMKAAAWVGAAFFLAAVVTSVLPLFLVSVNLIYRVGVLVPDLIFLYLARTILSHSTPEGALSVKRKALIGMFIGLIVFVGGAF